MTGLQEQSGGVVQAADFLPPGCEHAMCSFSGKYMTREDGALMRLGSATCDCTPKPAEAGALKSIGVTARQWSAPSPSDPAPPLTGQGAEPLAGRGAAPRISSAPTPDNDLDRFLALLPFAQPDSTGDLLVRALSGGGVHCAGLWPPPAVRELAALIVEQGYTCLVGLPQHLLALSGELPLGRVRTVLLCSDYAPPALRRRIEEACGCATFLHYGTTETGLGGGVECSAHDGCHLRESDLLVEIVDPHTGEPLPEGETGEVVVTTLGRQAMPLLRYRTGDAARLSTEPCACGGVTARLCDIGGRRTPCVLAGGFGLTSQDLDDTLFGVDGLLDYRATLDVENGVERLGIEILAGQGHDPLEDAIGRALRGVPAVAAVLELGTLALGPMRRVEAFSPSHTVKRTIFDQRGSCA
jgi:hypothetical protein